MRAYMSARAGSVLFIDPLLVYSVGNISTNNSGLRSLDYYHLS